jgi:hypothetical protein
MRRLCDEASLLQSFARMRRSRWFLLAGAASAILAARSTEQFSTHRFRPERARRQLDLSVRAGDVLTLAGGGCLRSSDGRTPERVVQPYSLAPQALIFIPGVTMTFVPVSDLIGRRLFVPSPLEYPGEPRVWLDWGSYFHSPVERPAYMSGEPAPCSNEAEDPYVDVTVESGSGRTDAAAAGTLTLEIHRYDANRLPLDPTWAGGARPDVCTRCEAFRVETQAKGPARVPALQSPACTLDRVYVDSGGCEPRYGDCPGWVERLAAHVDWGPAAFTGRVSTQGGRGVHVSLDGDVELFFEPDGGAGLLAPAPGEKYDSVIGLEFSSPETVRWFQTAWWRQFPFRVANYRPFAAFTTRLHHHTGEFWSRPAFRNLPATVVGIFNIDTAHNHPELHPVEGIAIRTESSSDRSVYQVFARNWGTGGDCGGRLDHRLDLSRLVLGLPGAGETRWTAAEGAFYDHGTPFSDWTVYGGGSSTSLVVELSRERRCSVVEGTLTLRREAGAAASAEHWRAGEPPVGEPVRLDAVPGGDQMCTKQEWFREAN